MVAVNYPSLARNFPPELVKAKASEILLTTMWEVI